MKVPRKQVKKPTTNIRMFPEAEKLTEDHEVGSDYLKIKGMTSNRMYKIHDDLIEDWEESFDVVCEIFERRSKRLIRKKA